MKQQFLIRSGHSRLVLFFAGWGGEENLFRHYRPVESDLLLCSDYRSLDFDVSMTEGYREIRLVGWSMGVWVASQVLPGFSLPLAERVAVNGTPVPVDDEQGIPVSVFRGTLDGFGPVTLQKFRRRMCGTTEGVKAFLSHNPCRSPEELHEELACLYGMVITRPVSSFRWDKALIGSRDRIFPPQNQQNAWAGVTTEIYDEEHYSDSLLRKALEGGWQGVGNSDDKAI